MRLLGVHVPIFDGAQNPQAHMGSFEISPQELYPTSAQRTERHVITSQPLHSLDSADPPQIEPTGERTAQFLVANDELARYYTATEVRITDNAFAATPNRVALIIGEGALAAALPHIPEETIIMADISHDMVNYLRLYRDTLRTAATGTDWQADLLAATSKYSEQRASYVRMQWEKQVQDWAHVGYTHPLISDSHFRKSRHAARDKAIIPYQIDITDPVCLTRLGNTLRGQNANITFMNLTNVLGYNNVSGDQAADLLSTLPITQNAPILTTSSLQPSSSRTQDGLQLGHLGATGPFFGLDNLRRGGSSITRGEYAGALAIRHVLVG